MRIEFKLEIETHRLYSEGVPVNVHFVREAATEFVNEAKNFFDNHPFLRSCSAMMVFSADEKKKLLKARPEPRPPKTREDHIKISTPAPRKR